MTSSSVYINEKLFLYWIEKILVPEVQARQRALELLNKAPALLILDGYLAHNEKSFKAILTIILTFIF